MSRSFIAFAAALSLAALLLAPSRAAAACLPAQPHYRYVGDTASNAQCTDDTIQSAIDNATCPDTTIFITGGHTYTAQHLNINGKSLTLAGSSQGCGPPGACLPGDSCDPSPPTQPIITVSGAGHSGDSVLWIHGNSHVTLQYLTIRDGNNVSNDHSTYGGGIHFDGTGTLALDTVTVMSNVAGYGGGIQFTGSGGFASLTLGPRTLIIGNTANGSGGGIRLDGQSYMSAFGDNSTIFNNKALNGYGGGLNVIGPAHADLASPGYGGIGIVSWNKAKYGGGIAITGGDDDGEDANVKLFTLDAQQPVRIDDNSATSKGGAIYLRGYDDLGGLAGFSDASLCAFDFRIDGNVAPTGAAMASDGEEFGNGMIWLNQPSPISDLCHGELPDYAQHCAAGTPQCNVVSGNVAADASGAPTTGAIFDADVWANRLEMRDNRGGYAIHGGAVLENCLLADGAYTQQLLRDDHYPYIFNCTFAGNTIGANEVIHAEGGLTLSGSIIHQPGKQVLAYSGDDDDVNIAYVLANEIGSLQSHGIFSAWAIADPGFADAAHGDYHLARSSFALDKAPAGLGGGNSPPYNGLYDDPGHDLDGRPRDQDIPGVVNFDGPRDLGAYERSPLQCGAADTIFCDGYEIF